MWQIYMLIGLTTLFFITTVTFASLYGVYGFSKSSCFVNGSEINEIGNKYIPREKKLLVRSNEELLKLYTNALKCFTVTRDKHHPVNTQPLITIMTRTFNRPNQLKRNFETVSRQVEQNFEQIILRDTVGGGMKTAEAALSAFKNEHRGSYIFHLDDDDFLSSYTFTHQMQNLIVHHKNPAIIIFKLFYTPYNKNRYYPTVWKQFPKIGEICTNNVLVRKDIYDKAIDVICSDYGGDYDYIHNAMVLARDETIVWTDECFALVQHTRDDKKFV